MASETSPNGNLGEVRYSILPPEEFNNVNGPGWVLLNGQAVQQNWDLYTQIFKPYVGVDDNPFKEIMNELPDARGVFLRGVNYGRNSNGDEVVNRLVGSAQQDAIQDHIHDMLIINQSGQVDEGGPKGWAYGEVNSGGRVTGGIHDRGMAAQETRPRNIAIFIYIKVNN